MQSEIWRRLHIIRIASGFRTPRAFANALGVDEDTIGDYLRATPTRLIRPNHLMKIRELTGYSTDYLLYGDKQGLTVAQKRELFEAEMKFEAKAADLEPHRGTARATKSS